MHGHPSSVESRANGLVKVQRKDKGGRCNHGKNDVLLAWRAVVDFICVAVLHGLKHI
jgi:hypothetical protein